MLNWDLLFEILQFLINHIYLQFNRYLRFNTIPFCKAYHPASKTWLYNRLLTGTPQKITGDICWDEIYICTTMSKGFPNPI